MSDELKFFEPQDLPRPKEAVQIVRLDARPYADGRRVRLHIGLTPSTQRPNLDVTVFNAGDEPVTSLNVIEAIDPEFELTLHLRGDKPGGTYTIRASLYFGDDAPQHTLETTFDAPPATGKLT